MSRAASESSRRRARGFTLLEVIVAFAIAAISLAALSQAFSTGLRQVDRMDATTAAMMLAQTKLAETEVDPELQPGTFGGQGPTGGTWQVLVSARPPAEALPVLYDIEVTAEVDGAVVALQTSRLGPSQ